MCEWLCFLWPVNHLFEDFHWRVCCAGWFQIPVSNQALCVLGPLKLFYTLFFWFPRSLLWSLPGQSLKIRKPTWSLDSTSMFGCCCSPHFPFAISLPALQRYSLPRFCLPAQSLTPLDLTTPPCIIICPRTVIEVNLWPIILFKNWATNHILYLFTCPASCRSHWPSSSH